MHYARLPNDDDAPLNDTTAEPDDTAEPVPADGDAALEAELSSFADLHDRPTAEQIPGQLDLTTLIDTTDHDTTDDDTTDQTQELA